MFSRSENISGKAMKDIISRIIQTSGISPPLSSTEAEGVAGLLGDAVGVRVYPSSIVAKDGVLLFLARREREKLLGLAAEGDSANTVGFSDIVSEVKTEGLTIRLLKTSAGNATALRKFLPFTAPRVVGLKKAIGCGDRLGLATPAHVRAVRGSTMVPFFAQQSIREMSRTRRTPREVMDSATWGVFQEGWRNGYGADADHLKTTEDIDACVEAGFTFFTIDPGEHVNSDAERLNGSELRTAFADLPWEQLESSADDCLRAYVGKTFDVSDALRIEISEEALMRAAVKYGRAIAHTVKMYRHLASKKSEGEFELEVSVDETDSPTSTVEHFYIASELKRLGVKWVSLAPRFVGEFEKGVDYKGDLSEFERSYAQHVEIARSLGQYKISIHSGSDKFSIYPIAARLSGELVHLKTAGTSYLEALRAVARVQPDLFREILSFAFEWYDEDRASYHVSADTSKVPRPEQLNDSELEKVLDMFDGRQMLHVTYGSVLTAEEGGKLRFRDRLIEVLKREEETHYEVVARHMRRHIEPFGA